MQSDFRQLPPKRYGVPRPENETVNICRAKQNFIGFLVSWANQTACANG